MKSNGNPRDEGLWQPEDINGWGIYRSKVNREYVDDAGDNLIFDTKIEALAFCRKLNRQEALA